jgi:hypothetical protein
VLFHSHNFNVNSPVCVEDIEFIQAVFSSLVKSNASTTTFRSGVLFYKTLEIIEELTSFGNRVGFSYLRIVIKKRNLVSALVIAYNRKGASDISMDEFEWVSSWFRLPFIRFLFYSSLDA